MPLPLIPILLGGASAIAGLIGIDNAGYAIDTNKQANNINEEASRIGNDATVMANNARYASKKAIDILGEAKLRILAEHMQPFVHEYSKIHHIELADTFGMNELKKFRIDKQDIEELQELGSMAASFLSGTASGAFGGAVTAFGAYSGVMALGAASTGTAISTLAGAAATNATLAWLGGGALAAGGLGMAGGTMVLGGIVAGPALAILGYSMSSKADANLDKARANLAKAKEHEEEMLTVKTLCDGISQRAQLFLEVLAQLDCAFVPMVDNITNILFVSGTDYRDYSFVQKKALSVTLSTAKAIKSVIDTALLTEKGELTPESGNLESNLRPMIEKAKTFQA